MVGWTAALGTERECDNMSIRHPGEDAGTTKIEPNRFACRVIRTDTISTTGHERYPANQIPTTLTIHLYGDIEDRRRAPISFATIKVTITSTITLRIEL